MRAPSSHRREFLKRAPVGAAALTGLPLRLSTPTTFDPGWFSGLWERTKAYTLAIAESMPENRYGFRPTDDTRTFAEQLLHVAGANAFFAGQVGATPPPTQDLEAEGKSKSQVIRLLAESFDYAAGILEGLDLEQSEERIQVVGQSLTRWEVLHLMRDHVTHHRGQMIVYLRLNGITPPQYVGF